MEQESQKREVEEAGCQPPPSNGGGPVLCMNNCGFFGTPATNNFCSKCYKDFYLNQAKAAAASTTTTTVIVVSENKELPTVEGLDPVGEEGQEDKGGIEEGATSGDPGRRGGGSNRCSFCNKRVGLTGFKCRCDLTFCSVHRYSDKHNCLFDYKSAAQDAIAKANPVVKAEKIEKI